MAKKITALLIISVLLPIHYTNAAKVNLTGISEDRVIVDGHILEVGDRYKGVEVVAIEKRSVTFKDSDGKVFSQDLKPSFWERLVGKFKKFSNKNNTKQSTLEKKQGFFENLAKKTKPKTIRADNLSIGEKQQLADEYLEQFRQESNSLLSTMEGKSSSSQEVAKGMSAFNKVMKDHDNKFNNLRLPCSAAGAAGSTYWSESYQAKHKSIIDGINQRLERIAKSSSAKVNSD